MLEQTYQSRNHSEPQTLVAVLQTFSHKVSISVFIIGCVVIFGWIFNIALLKSVLPGLVTMKANTALGFIVGGGALWGWHKANQDVHYLWVKVGAGIVLSLGLLTLFQYGSGWDLGIDQLFFKEAVTAVGTSTPGRMAPNTALNFLLLGLALFLLFSQSIYYRFIQLLGITTFLIALLGLLGYAYNVKSLYGIGSYTQMAMHTSVAFILLSLGVLFARPDRGVMTVVTSDNAGGLMARKLSPAVLGMPPILGWIILAGYRAKAYDTEVGISLISVCNIVVFAGFIWWNAQSLGQLDGKRASAEEEIRNLNTHLETRVNERTAELTHSNAQLQQLQMELNIRQKALDEAAIVSETDLEGTIIFVNEKFCKISGYSREELIGKNHRIINSGFHPQSFFAELWKTISQGKIWKGEVKNKAKDGACYWVDTTISPIFNAQGEIIKYIGIRFDITERKLVEEKLENVATERQSEAETLTRQALKLLNEVKGAAKGDLTVKADVSNESLGAIADSFNFLIVSLRKVVNGIQEMSSQVKAATGKAISNTDNLTTQADNQAQQIENALRKIERMVNSIKDVCDVSIRAEKVAQQASETAGVGGQAVDRAVEGINTLRQTISQTAKMMKRLGESSQQIGKIVTSISQIAAQTNLLALNATIEAARAGEQGQGFAVVADEVRKLAERSAGATEEISEIVEQIRSEVDRVMQAMEAGTQEVVTGTQLATEAKTHLVAIIQVSQEINALVQNITRAATKQVVFAEEISGSMQQVNEISGLTAQKSLDVRNSLESLAVAVNKLQSSVANFRS